MSYTPCPLFRGVCVFKGMDALACELYYIAVEADRAGRAAVIDDQSVAILTSTRTPRVEGPSYVSFRIDRVRSIVEARQLLASAAP